MSVILETNRLCLRKLRDSDFPALCQILQDPAVMYAYEHAFTEAEVWQWLANQQRRYTADGFGLWAVVEKATRDMIGQCGLTLQDCRGEQVMEVGYLFRKASWHCGYAIEAAQACRDYAFRTLPVQEVHSLIRDSNRPSQQVAHRNGMTLRGNFLKYYYHQEMPHLIYSIQRQEWNCQQGHSTLPASQQGVN